MDPSAQTGSKWSQAVLIIAISLALGLGYDYLFYRHAPGLNFPLFVGLMLAGLFALAAFSQKRLDKKIWWLILPLAFFSVMVFVRASALLTALNILTVLALLLLITENAIGKKIKDYLLGGYVWTAFLPFQFIGPFFKNISDTWSGGSRPEKRQLMGQIIKGVAMAIPILALFIILLSSADLIFQKYVTDLIDINVTPETVWRIVVIGFVAAVLTGAYAYIFRRHGESGAQELDSQEAGLQKSPPAALFNPSIGHVEVAILLGSVSVLFLIFILIQAAYLFGGSENISVQGFTYAEYARRGFFELIAVAIISFLMLLAVEKYTARDGTNHRLLFKILSSGLIAEVIVMMISASRRLSLYEDAYGFTTLRLFSHAFIVWLAIIFILLLYKIFKDRRENMLAFRLFISVLLFVAVMNALNPDAFIARKNLARYEAIGKLDAYYLGLLSHDALPTIIKVLDFSDGQLKHDFAQAVMLKPKATVDRPRWQSANLSRIRAEKILRPRLPEIKKYSPESFE